MGQFVPVPLLFPSASCLRIFSHVVTCTHPPTSPTYNISYPSINFYPRRNLCMPPNSSSWLLVPNHFFQVIPCLLSHVAHARMYPLFPLNSLYLYPCTLPTYSSLYQQSNSTSRTAFYSPTFPIFLLPSSFIYHKTSLLSATSVRFLSACSTFKIRSGS